MDTGAYVDSLLASAHELPPRDEIFDVGDLAGLQQQQFVFDQDDIDFGAEQSGMAFVTGIGNVGSGDMHTLPDQTQLATKVGEDLLGFEHINSVNEDNSGTPAFVGHVVVPEAEQLEAAAFVEKRKRDADEAGDMEPAAKRSLNG
jgi:hypothetical protein